MRLIVVAILVSSLVVVLSFFTDVIFGQNWAGSGLILLCMIPLFIGTIVVVPTNHLIALKRQELQFIADLTRVILVGFSVGTAVVFNLDFYFAVLLCSIASLLGYVILALMQVIVHKNLNKKVKM